MQASIVPPEIPPAAVAATARASKLNKSDGFKGATLWPPFS